MAVQLFGRFLTDRGEVDEFHIREAVMLMETENATLGEHAIAWAFMQQTDVDHDAGPIGRAPQGVDVRMLQKEQRLRTLSPPEPLADLSLENHGFRVGEAPQVAPLEPTAFDPPHERRF